MILSHVAQVKNPWTCMKCTKILCICRCRMSVGVLSAKCVASMPSGQGLRMGPGVVAKVGRMGWMGEWGGRQG